MVLSRIRVGFAITGSFCSIAPCLTEIENLVKVGAEVFPIFSVATYSTDTRFFKAQALRGQVQNITNKRILSSITETEPLGPKNLIDILLIAPCTSNTLAKIANGINDTPVTMATKSILRNGLPVVLAISTNDGLSASAQNIGTLLNRRNIYFVPFGQDAPFQKERSLVAKFKQIPDALSAALSGVQLQPLLAQ